MPTFTENVQDTVVVADDAVEVATYVSVDEIRAEGVSDNDATDDTILSTLLVYQQYIERQTRQFFNPRRMQIDIDGTDSDTLFLPAPILSVEQLFVNDDFVNAFDKKLYIVYSQRGPVVDDRRNPKIRMKRAGFFQTAIFWPSPFGSYGSVFLKGVRNHRILGTFGFVEPDGSTPLLIKRALKLMVLRDLAMNSSGLFAAAGDPVFAHVGLSETTDGHSITFQSDKSRSGAIEISKDPEVEKILEMYRCPLAIGVTGSMMRLLG